MSEKKAKEQRRKEAAEPEKQPVFTVAFVVWDDGSVTYQGLPKDPIEAIDAVQYAAGELAKRFVQMAAEGSIVKQNQSRIVTPGGPGPTILQ